MSRVLIHPRVLGRQSELDESDVAAAMRSMLRYKRREAGEWVAVGADSRGRLVELAYVYDDNSGCFLVCHAMTPPGAPVMRDLDLGR